MAFELAHTIDFRPGRPGSYNPPIGMIGCGGITVEHLRAYRNAGLHVTAFCDLNRSRAEVRRAEFYPEAIIYDDYQALLRDPQIEVVDITTHPHERVELIAAAIDAGKHVLSQKPFVLDLDVGERLVAAAEQRGVRLAVNQNGRWAPHFCYMRRAIASGLIGDPFAAHLAVHWDHTWVQGTPFENVKHLILYDFAIHWFDMVRCLLPGKDALRVFASRARVPGQRIMPALLGQALIEFEEAQASLVFDASVGVAPLDTSFVTGTTGNLTSVGVDINSQVVTLQRREGSFQPPLQGRWFPDGFQGAMVELLQSIEAGRQPSHSAADNLKSLELCFAAVASAETGRSIRPGEVRKLPA